MLIHVNETRSEFLIDNAKSILGWVLNPLSFLMASLGETGEKWAKALQNNAYGDWLPVSAAIGISIKAATLLLIPLGPRSTIDRLWPSLPYILDREISTDAKTEEGEASILPRAKGQPFYGRALEILRLEQFTKESYGPCAVFGLEGAEGMGKSHLAHEWLLRLKSQRRPKWDVGYLLPNVTAETVRRTHFRRPTAIVIDEIERTFENPEDLWNLLAALAEKAKKRPIRIIIADQALERPHNDIDAVLKDTLSHIWRETSFLRLDGLVEAEARKLNPDLAPLEDGESGYRPLFLRREAQSDQDIVRRAARRLSLAEKIGADAERSLILGALAGPIDWEDIEAALEKQDTLTLGPLNKKWRKLRPLFEGASKDALKHVLPNLAPNDISNRVILQWADEHPKVDLDKYVDLAAHLNPAALARRIMSLWSLTLSDEDQEIVKNMEKRLDQAHPAWIATLHAKADHFVTQTYNASQNMDKQAFENALSRLMRLASYRAFDPVLQLRKTMGAVNATKHYGQAQKFDSLERWGDVLIDTAAAFPQNEEIQLEKAIGAFNAIKFYGQAQNFDALERWGNTLLDTTAAYPQNEEIQLRKAKGAVNVTSVYGPARNFDALNRWGDILLDTAAAYPHNEEIQLDKAKGAFNAMSNYGQAQDFDALEHWGNVLIDTAAASPQNEEIQRWKTSGAVNAMSNYGQAQDFDALERWGNVLMDTAAAYPQNEEIQLHKAMGAFNALINYKEAGQHETEVYANWKENLARVARDFPVHPEIQHQAGRYNLTAAQQILNSGQQ